MMPTDCSVRRTPTILPSIRISWDYHPTFMLISGWVPRSKSTYEQAHVDLDLLTLTSSGIIISEFLYKTRTLLYKTITIHTDCYIILHKILFPPATLRVFPVL